MQAIYERQHVRWMDGWMRSGIKQILFNKILISSSSKFVLIWLFTILTLYAINKWKFAKTKT